MAEHRVTLEPENYAVLAKAVRAFGGGPRSWKEIFGAINDYIGLRPVYPLEQSTSFAEMRRRLNSEAGVLIANHPCSLDMALLMPALERSDILMMVQRKRFDFIARLLGKENVIPAPASRAELSAARERVKEHIESKKGLIMFPSGGAEMKEEEFTFKSGFRFLVSGLAPETMIYLMHIDPDKGRKIMRDVVGPPRDASDNAIALAPEFHVRKQDNPIEVPVREAYTTAAEWQALKNPGKTGIEDKNRLFGAHFLAKFN